MTNLTGYTYIDTGNTSLGSIIITGTTNSTSIATTGAGSTITMDQSVFNNGSNDGLASAASPAKERYSATLVFSYVKSKLTKVEQGRLKTRLARLKYLLETCDETEQFALRDTLLAEAAIAVRQQECAACGCDQYVDRKIIERFRKEAKTTIDFGKLETFPRPVPENVRKKIQQVREKGLFDDLWVLYNNPSKEQLKSTKDKITEKDPILFGTFVYAPDTFYYITDWIDEVCDLTFEQFVGKIKAVDPQFAVQAVEPLSLRDIIAIKDRAKLQHERLKGTNRGNFRELAEAERKPLFERDPIEVEKAVEEITAAPEPDPLLTERVEERKSLWRRVLTFFDGNE